MVIITIVLVGAVNGAYESINPNSETFVTTPDPN